MITPEVQGSLIGVGALCGAWALRATWDYAKYKLTGNGRCSNNGHCRDHSAVMQILKHLQESHEDEKQVELITRAIKRANGSTDPRD